MSELRAGGLEREEYGYTREQLRERSAREMLVERASADLSRLIHEKVGVLILPTYIGNLLTSDNFEKVSRLAHIIHRNRQR